MAVWIVLSIVVAATVMSHDALFEMVWEIGPEFPAELTIVILLEIAWKEPIAIVSRWAT